MHSTYFRKRLHGLLIAEQPAAAVSLKVAVAGLGIQEHSMPAFHGLFSNNQKSFFIGEGRRKWLLIFGSLKMRGCSMPGVTRGLEEFEY